MPDSTKSKSSFWQLLKKDWNPDYFLFLAVWTVVCLLFSKPINNIFNFIGDTLFQYAASILYDILSILLFVLFIIIRSRTKLYKTRFKYWILLSLTALVIWYSIARIGIEPKIQFIPFSLFQYLKLLDFIFVAIIFEIFKIAIETKLQLTEKDELRKNLNIKQERSSQSSFITDLAYNPENKEHNDLLNFEPFAQRMVNEAMNISSLESVVFGINGEWGEGKTSMINLIHQKLEAEKYTVVKFHPWKTNSGKAVTQLFFDVLKEGLEGKIAGINWEINRYAEALLNLDQSGFGKTLWQLFFPSDSVENQKEKLAKSMQLLDKNLIVIVDDLDRLAKNEISDVLKLMRDTANFPNLVFIAAYDRKYLNEAIRSEISLYKAENYMDKIVLWEAQIYKPQPRRYFEELKKYLKIKLNEELHSEIDKICSTEQEKFWKLTRAGKYKGTAEENNEHIDTLYDINLSLFLNLRTVKRFTNEFIFNFRIVADKVELRDFYYLSLLRFFFHDHYLAFVRVFSDVNLLSENNLLPGIIEKNVDAYFARMNVSNEVKDEKGTQIAKAIMSMLLTTDNESEKNFVYRHNFPIYFHLGNYFDITRTDFALLIVGTNFEEYKKNILSVTENQKDSIYKLGFYICLDILFQDMSKRNLDKTEQLKLIVWFSAKMNDSLFFELAYDLTNRFFVRENYFAVDTEKKQKNIIDFILKENLEYKIIAFYAPLAKIYISSSTKESFISSTVVFAYFKTKFKEHLKSFEGINSETILLYYFSYLLFKRNGAHENDQEIIKMMRQKVKKYPSDFIKFIVILDDGSIPHSSNPTRYYQRFSDFLLKIFKDLNEFLDFLKITDFKEEAYRAKSYLKYAEKGVFYNSDLSLPNPFLPEDDYEEFYSKSFTKEELTDWRQLENLNKTAVE